MQKLFISLLLLCGMTAAWAGTGDGSKDNPYSGEWQVSELVSLLKVGDCLAYDCVISNGIISIYDNTLDTKLCNYWAKFVMGDPIDDTPFSDYREGCDYCSVNTFENRKGHVFQIEEVEVVSQDEISLRGSYSGKYYYDIDTEHKPEAKDEYTVYVDEDGKICVHTAEELMAAIRQHYYKEDVVIQVMNDIDMTNYHTPGFMNTDGKVYGADFRCTLCGYYNKKTANGEFVRDEKGNIKVYSFELSHLNEPLFNYCHGAAIRGIKVIDSSLSSPIRKSQFLICEDAYDTEFTDVSIEGCRYDDKVLLKDLPYGVGFIYDFVTGNYLGLMTRTMTNCTVNKVDVIGCTIYLRGKGVGGITGYAKGTTFDNCIADASSTVFVETVSDAYAGGLVGEGEDCTFIRCVNLSAVYGSEHADNVGGICGYSTKCHFDKCYNGGVLDQTTKETWAISTAASAYGIYSSLKSLYGIGAAIDELRDAILTTEVAFNNYMNTTCIELLADNLAMFEIARTAEMMLVLTDFFTAVGIAASVYTLTSSAIIYTNSPDEMGGITSAAYGCEFDRCINAGRLFCRDAYAGGIVGKSGSSSGKQTEIRHCINSGFIQSSEQSGGIVGYMEDTHVDGCLNVGTIDCADSSTAGPIYGEADNSTSATNCFAVAHDAADHPDGLPEGQQVTEVSYQDVISGLVAWELNRMSGTRDFCQNVGKQAYPTLFGGKGVDLGDVRQDVDPVYKVADYRDFVNAIFNQYAQIELIKDVDFNQAYISVYRRETPFRGSIDGKGYSLKNIYIDNRDFASDYSSCYAMIGAAEGATFKNFDIQSSTFELKTEGSALVYISNDCLYENLRISDNTIVSAKPRTGGLVYESNNDNFVNCGIGIDVTVTASPFYGGNHMPVRETPVGGLAWKAIGSKFTDCYNAGTVTADFGPVGGLVAICNDCNFIHCENSDMGLVQSHDSPDSAGGIAATATISRFYRCANYGRVKATNKYAGAIVGDAKGVTLNSCYQASMTGLEFDNSERSKSGIFIGRATNNSVLINCASYGPGSKYPMIGEAEDVDIDSGNNYRQKLDGAAPCADWEAWVTSVDFVTGRVCYWLNNAAYNRDQKQSPWHMTDIVLHLNDDGAPATVNDIVNEKSEDAFKIYEPADLVAFAKQVNDGDQFACAVLMNDIDMSTVTDFTPIGKDEPSRHYRGIFNGNGHTIDYLKVTSDKAVGLFGAVHANASINNVIIGENCEFTSTGNEGVAGIVGKVAIGWKWGNVVIDNCANFGTINAQNTANAGGILGLVKNTTEDNVRVFVNDCYNLGTVNAENGNSGLLCGYMCNSGVVTNCWSGAQLRTSTEGVKPYDDTQGRSECFVGYWDKLYINDCLVVAPEHNVDLYGEQPLQEGVEIISDESARSGELCYKLNKGVIDGSQPWYQTIGTNNYPVRTKLTDGTNMVFRYKDADNITRYGNTSHKEISDVILGISAFDDHRITDVNESGDVDVTDVTSFTEAANK